MRHDNDGGYGRGLRAYVTPHPWPATGSRSATGGQTVVVTPGARYRAGWPHTLLFGRRYRDLWATPIEVEVLDLTAFAGGLTPLRRGGFGQSLNLRFTGADGRARIKVDPAPTMFSWFARA